MKRIISIFLLGAIVSSCNYLDVVPDNVATIDYAFSMRSSAEKYLFTCYSWLPHHADDLSENPALTAGDEIWLVPYIQQEYVAWRIATGNQNVVNPYVNFWSGEHGGVNMYRAIRECNIFLENIGGVSDMSEYEKARWSAEVKFLKAYYHFLLFRMYGPIPLIRENLPISASVNEVKSVVRSPVDECVDYMIQLLDEAAADLPEEIQAEVEELGRVTKPIALSLKAYVLVTAASPLYNGNKDFAAYVNPDGQQLFNQEYDAGKWEKAATACKEAVELCHAMGASLYYFEPGSGDDLSEATIRELSVRNPLTQKWNVEQIWTNTNSMAGRIQGSAQPKLYPGASRPRSRIAPTLRIAEMFYTNNGVPIDEDKTFDYSNRYSLRTATEDDRYYLRPGAELPILHFDREPRFYADLAFDGGRWYGTGRFDDDDNLYLEAKAGEVASSGGVFNISATGYWPKKLINYLNNAAPDRYTTQQYPWPVIRLAELYLLYAEALNETSGPGPEVYKWLNLIRERAGLGTVEESWTNYSKQPEKYTTREGLREIIHRERLIEMAFEGHRFWDIKRWKKAPEIWNKPIRGWTISGEDEASYYRVKVLYNLKFRLRDYFWPIKESELLVNKNLLQSPGW